MTKCVWTGVQFPSSPLSRAVSLDIPIFFPLAGTKQLKKTCDAKVTCLFLIKFNFPVKQLADFSCQIVRDEQDRFVRLQQTRKNFSRGGLINGARTFVNQQQLAVVKIAAGKNYFLPLAARDVAVFNSNPRIQAVRPKA